MPFRRRVLPCGLTGDLTSFGGGSRVLKAMYKFPDVFDTRDQYFSIDSDLLRQRGPDHFEGVNKLHFGWEGIQGLGMWVSENRHEEILAYLQDLMSPLATQVAWEGFRISGSVHAGTGFVVWHLEVFKKHPDTKTKLYSGVDLSAPNVLLKADAEDLALFLLREKLYAEKSERQAILEEDLDFILREREQG